MTMLVKLMYQYGCGGFFQLPTQVFIVILRFPLTDWLPAFLFGPEAEYCTLFSLQWTLSSSMRLPADGANLTRRFLLLFLSLVIHVRSVSTHRRSFDCLIHPKMEQCLYSSSLWCAKFMSTALYYHRWGGLAALALFSELLILYSILMRILP